jgi:hypothetical protein
MANTYDADLVTDILSRTALTTLGSDLTMLEGFSTDVSDERGAPRQVIQVELVTAAGSVVSNPVNFEVTAATNTNIPVTLTHLSRPVEVSAQDLNQGQRLETKAKKALQVISNAIQDACLSLVTAANYTNTMVELLAAQDAAAYAKFLKDMWAGITGGQRNLVLTNETFAQYLPTNLDSFDPTRQRAGLYGYNLFTHSSRFVAASAQADIVGFVADPSAMAIAARLPADPGAAKERDYIVSEVVLIGELNIPVEFNVWFSRATRSHWMSYDVCFGAAKGDPSALTIGVLGT